MLPLLALLAACSGGKADSDTAPVCDATIASATPADGAGPVARAATVRLTLSGTTSSATVTATGADGTAYPGTTSLDGDVATFTPDAPFPEGTTVTWSAQVCDATATGTFTTGSLEQPVDAASLAGKTYAVDLSEATWVSPEGGGDMVSQVFAGRFLIGVQAADAATIDCIGASGEETSSGSWQQDPCYATIDFDPADFTNDPYFLLTADKMESTVQGQTVIIHGATISGGLTADSLVDGHFSGEVDMRDYRAQFGDQGCDVLEMYVGISCTACKSDGAVQCLWLEAEDVTGDHVPGLTVVPNDDPQECNTDTGGK